jgi:hypothetical protein
MVDLALNRHDNWTGSGWEGYLKTRVKRAHDGDENFWAYAPFDQGDWTKKDPVGQSTYEKSVDEISLLAFEKVTADVLVAGIGTHRIRRRLTLPRNFGRSGPSPIDSGTPDTALGLFPAGSIVGFAYRSGAISDLLATLYIDGVADPGVDVISIKPVGAGAWEMFSLSPSWAYLPGAALTFEIEYDASDRGVFVGLSDLIVKYRTARGTA